MSGPASVTRRRWIDSAAQYLCILALLLSVCGCRWTRSLLTDERESPGFQSVRINFRFDEPVDHLSRQFQAEPDSLLLDQTPTTPAPDDSPSVACSNGELEIRYPHPQGDHSQAEVVLTLVNGTRRGRARRESHVLTIARSQLELLIGDLATDGFFDKRSRDDGDAELDVEIDRKRTRRTWRFEPRLLDLAHRVLADGQPDDSDS